MNKRISLVALVLSVMMLFALSVPAFAAPSPTVPDMNNVDDEYEFEDPDVPSSGFIMDILKDASQSDDPKVKKVFEKIEKFLEFYQEKKGKASEVFGKKVLDLIAELLPEGYDIEKVNLDELVVMTALNYNEAFGDVKATFEFATEYEEDDEVIAIVGVYDDKVLEAEESEDDDEEFKDEANWMPLEAEVVKGKDGKNKVKVNFTKESLSEIGEKPFALGILKADK